MLKSNPALAILQDSAQMPSSMRPALILLSNVFPELLAGPSVHGSVPFPPGTREASISEGQKFCGSGLDPGE